MRLFVVHFSPLELYPPVQNFIRILDSKPQANSVRIITTNPVINVPVFVAKNVIITRKGKSSHHFGAIKRYLNYLIFYFSCFSLLLYYRPVRLLYYETISSFPVYIYKKFINRKAMVFIHYHEYTSVAEYKHGMLLARWFHRLEKNLYYSAKSVSHTNALRMEKFKQDIAPVTIHKPTIIPNYPPRYWYSNKIRELGSPLKVIYVGAFSMKTMHIKNFAEWILSLKGDVLWDIYSFNYTDDAAYYISSLASQRIRLKNGVDYPNLPMILQQYDVGVILYNGHIPNYIYNAPNKLFEYLACGLDVWFPIEMVGCYEHVTQQTFPKVVALDFQKLSQINLPLLLSRDELTHHPNFLYCESVYEKLYKNLIEHPLIKPDE